MPYPTTRRECVWPNPEFRVSGLHPSGPPGNWVCFADPTLTLISHNLFTYKQLAFIGPSGNWLCFAQRGPRLPAGTRENWFVSHSRARGSRPTGPGIGFVLHNAAPGSRPPSLRIGLVSHSGAPGFPAVRPGIGFVLHNTAPGSRPARPRIGFVLHNRRWKRGWPCIIGRAGLLQLTTQLCS